MAVFEVLDYFESVSDRRLIDLWKSTAFNILCVLYTIAIAWLIFLLCDAWWLALKKLGLFRFFCFMLGFGLTLGLGIGCDFLGPGT